MMCRVGDRLGYSVSYFQTEDAFPTAHDCGSNQFIDPASSETHCKAFETIDSHLHITNYCYIKSPLSRNSSAGSSSPPGKISAKPTGGIVCSPSQ